MIYTNHILENFSFDNLISQTWEPKEKTFEFLCGEFMQIYFWLNTTPMPSVDNSSYPGIEWPPVYFNWSYYWYQSKFGEKAFVSEFWESSKAMEMAINDWVYLLTHLCLFAKKDKVLRSKNKESFDNLLSYLRDDLWLIVNEFYWQSFLTELKNVEYAEIVYKYFWWEQLKKEIFSKKKMPEPVDCPTEVETIKKGISSSFEWDPLLYDKELERAKLLQERYSINKYCFINEPWIYTMFDDIEDFVATKTFPILETHDFTWLDHYLERWVYYTRHNNVNSVYWSELDNLLDSRDGLYINYLWENKAKLKYIANNKVHFIWL